MKNRLKLAIVNLKDSLTVMQAARAGKTIITNNDGTYTILQDR